jgi:hypothetical protein
MSSPRIRSEAQVTAAAQRYAETAEATNEAINEWKNAPSRQRHELIVQAIRIENAALAEYAKALNVRSRIRADE